VDPAGNTIYFAAPHPDHVLHAVGTELDNVAAWASDDHVVRP
jgi:hypothetical protein